MHKVTLVTGIYPPDIGGPASHFQELVYYFNKSNILSYKLITLSSGDKPADGNIFFINRKYIKPKRLLLVIIKIIKLSKCSSCIYSGGLYIESFIASLISGKRLIFRVVGDPVWERARNSNNTSLGIDDFQTVPLPISLWIQRIMFNYIFKKAEYIVTPSLYLKTIIEGWGVDPNKIKVIVNAVDINYKNVKADSEKKYDLITVCRLVPWKGVDELIEISKINNLSLAIVGDGPELKALEFRARSHKGGIVFLGNLCKKKIAKLLSESKIFFLNSSYEGLPHSLLEAMALGMPCIATETGGSKAVMTNNFDGLLVPLEGMEHKSEVIVRLLKDVTMQNKLSKNAKNTISTNYSLSNMFENLTELFLYK